MRSKCRILHFEQGKFRWIYGKSCRPLCIMRCAVVPCAKGGAHRAAQWPSTLNLPTYLPDICMDLSSYKVVLTHFLCTIARVGLRAMYRSFLTLQVVWITDKTWYLDVLTCEGITFFRHFCGGTRITVIYGNIVIHLFIKTKIPAYAMARSLWFLNLFFYTIWK